MNYQRYPNEAERSGTVKRLTRSIGLLAMLIIVAVLLTGCAAGTERFSAEHPAGF
jgi:hypothetical protein